MNGIVLIEGADAAGKSTLARYLVDRYGAKYLHSTVRRQVWRWHVGALRTAIRESQRRLVVLDRLHISELVYGAVFRGGPEAFGYGPLGIGARSIDRVLRRFGAVTVLCAPLDQQRQIQRWETGRANGKMEHFPSVRQVIQLYADLRHGNVAHPGDGYLDQLIRFGDFTDRDDVLVYDLDHYRGDKGPERFAKVLMGRLATLRRRTVPYQGNNLVGRGDPDRSGWLFVGEAISPATKSWAPRVPRWAWCDRDDHLGAATWLNRALHHLAVREDRLTFTNARPEGAGDYLPQLLATHADSSVIALGLTAHARIRELGCRAHLVSHPQWHRRFRFGEGPEGYASILREVMNAPADNRVARTGADLLSTSQPVGS